MKKLLLAAFAFILLATPSIATNACRFCIVLESLNNPFFVPAQDGHAAIAKGLGFVACIDFSSLEQVITPSTTKAGR